MGYDENFPLVKCVGDETVQVEVRRGANGLFFFGALTKGTHKEFMVWREKNNRPPPAESELLEDMRRCGCPGRTIDDLRRRLKPTQALDASKRFSGARREDLCLLLLLGPAGVGKSVAAAAAMMAHGRAIGGRAPGSPKPYLWIQASRFIGISHFEDTDRQFLAEVEKVGFLVVDEIGSDQASKTGHVRVTELLLARFAQRRATVLTGNLKHSEFEEAYGKALVDRIRSGGMDPDLSKEKTNRQPLPKNVVPIFPEPPTP